MDMENHDKHREGERESATSFREGIHLSSGEITEKE